MSKLCELKAKNPTLKFYSVNDKEFARYGCVLKGDYSSLVDAALALPMPEVGSKYEPTVPSFCPAVTEAPAVIPSAISFERFL